MGLLEDLAGGGGGASMPNLNQLIRPPDPLGAALAEMSQRFAQAGQASRLPTSTLGALGSALGGAGAAADAANKTYLDQAIKLQALQRALKQAGYDDTVAKFIAQRMLGGGAQAAPAVPGAPTATATPGAPPTAAPAATPGAPPAAAATATPGGGYDPLTGNPLDAPAALSPLPPAAPRGMVPVNLPPGSPGTVTWGNTTYGPAGGGKITTSGLLGPDTVLPTEGGPAAGDTQAAFRPASLVEPARAGNGGADPLRLAGLLAGDPEAAADPLAGLLATDAPIQPGGPDTLVGQTRSQLPVELASMRAPRSEQQIINAESGGNPYIGYGGTDLTNAPRNPAKGGFPIWAGKQGPDGISHAAGLYQFEPDTYAEGAKALGINDFSPASQKAVYDWTRAKYGDSPWRASEGGGSPIIKAQYAPGGGGAPALVGPGSGTIPGLNMTPQEVAALNALSTLAGHTTPPFKEFLDIYYKSPEYLRQSAQETALGQRAATEPSDIRINAAKEAEARVSKYLEQLGNAANTLAPNGILVPDGQGGTQRVQATVSQAVRAANGLPVPELGIAGMYPDSKSGAPAGGAPAGAPVAGTPTGTPARTVGEPVLTPGQKTSQELSATAGWKAIEDTHAAELAANKRTQLYGQMAEAMKGFTPGATAEARIAGEGILKDLGFISGSEVPAAEAFNRAARQLQLTAAPKGQGQVSNYERELYAQAVTQMSNSPEGLAKAIDMAQRLDNYDRQVAAIHRDVATANHGTPNVLEAERRIAALGPPLSPSELASLQAIAAGNVPRVGGATAAPAAPAPIKTPYGTIRPVQ